MPSDDIFRTLKGAVNKNIFLHIHFRAIQGCDNSLSCLEL